MCNKYLNVKISVLKNGFLLNFDDARYETDNTFVAGTLDEVKEILNTKLNLEGQE